MSDLSKWEMYFDFVGEQSASIHVMNQTELCINCTKNSAFCRVYGDKIPYSLSCNSFCAFTFDDLNAEVIICIPIETGISIRTYFVLPIYFRNRRTNIMGMKTFLRNLVFQTKNSTILNKYWSYYQRMKGEVVGWYR